MASEGNILKASCISEGLGREERKMGEEWGKEADETERDGKREMCGGEEGRER